MTTIVYRNGLLAADTKTGIDKGKKGYYEADKIRVFKLYGKYHAFAGCGTQQAVNAIIDWECSGRRQSMFPDKLKGKDAKRTKVIKVRPKGSGAASYTYENNTTTELVDQWSNYSTAGSGWEVAYFYLNYRDCNALEAVVKACKYEENTDWPIHYWMPGWKKHKVMTLKDWKNNKKYYRNLGR